MYSNTIWRSYCTIYNNSSCNRSSCCIYCCFRICRSWSYFTINFKISTRKFYYIIWCRWIFSYFYIFISNIFYRKVMYFPWNDKRRMMDKIKVPNCIKQLGTNKLLFLSDGHYSNSFKNSSKVSPSPIPNFSFRRSFLRLTEFLLMQ